MSGFEESSAEDTSIGEILRHAKVSQPEANDTAVTSGNSSLGAVDIFVVILYFIITLGVGLWVCLSNKYYDQSNFPY